MINLMRHVIIRSSIHQDKKVKVMPKQKQKNRVNFMSHHQKRPAGRLVVSFMLIGLLSVGLIPRIVHAVSCNSAASCQAQINNLNNQSSEDKQSVSNLQSQAQTYQETVDSLNAQIASLQAEINSNVAKQASLESQITANEQEIAEKKSTLSDDITTMYVNGQMSTIEELATSQNLSAFVDKQQYRSVVQDQLTSIIQQISALEESLQSQKTQVDQLVSTEQSQNSQLAYSQSQAQQLVNYNQAQQAQYNAQIASASSNVSQLEVQLTALNNAGTTAIISGGVCGGGYPTSTPSATAPGTEWGCDQPQDNTTDNWGMDNRECVSYTAFMVHEEYLGGEAAHDMPKWAGEGNAYQWIADAEAAGVPVSQTPEPGDIAIRSQDPNIPGDVGHAMYVIAVQSDSNITVGEYNEHYNGTYDERSFDPLEAEAPIYYLNFEQW